MSHGHCLLWQSSLPILVGDPVLLTQVFQNLIAHAIKFQNGEEPRVGIWAEKRASEWIFSIRDNGIGIESRHLDRIFAFSNGFIPLKNTPAPESV